MPTGPLNRLAAVAALLIAAVPVGIYLWCAAHRLTYPYELDWLEGGTVELVARAAHGHSLYGPPNITYAGFTYTPLFFYLAAAVSKITGLGFLPLRIVSLGFSLIGFGALFLYVRDATRDRLAALVAVGLFAAMYGLTGWFFDVGRADSMYVALSLLALWLGRRAEGVGAGLLVGIVAFLAFFTKQTGLIAVAPALVLGVGRRQRAAASALITLIVLAGASTLLIDALTHHWYRFFIVDELAGQPSVEKNKHLFWSQSLLHHLHWLALLALVGLLLAAATAGVVVLRGRGTGSEQRRFRAVRELIAVPFLYDIGAAAGLLAAGYVSYVHSGSYLNVLMPAYAACAGAGGLAAGALRRLGHGTPLGLISTLIVLVLAALQVNSLVRHEYALRSIPTHADRVAGRQLERALRRLPGRVLVLRHPWYGTAVHKGAFAQADGLFEILRSQNARGRRELTRALRGSLNRDHVDAVVLDDLPAPPWMAPQLARDFRLRPAPITRSELRPVADLRSWPRYVYIRVHGPGAPHRHPRG